MPLVTVYPDGTTFNGLPVYGGVGFDLDIAAPLHSILADGDVHWAGKALPPGTVNPVASGEVYFADPAIPAGARIQWVRPWVRLGSAGGAIDPVIGVYLGDTSYDDGSGGNPQSFGHEFSALPADGVVRYAPGPQYARPPIPTIQDWDAGTLNRMSTRLFAREQYASGGGDESLTQVGIDVQYMRGGAVVFDPSFTGSDTTAKPTIKWVSSAPDQATPQAAYRLAIFPNAVYVANGIGNMNNPAVLAQATYDSGVVYDSAARAKQVGTSLQSGAQYVAIVYVSQPWSGVDSSGWWNWIAGGLTVHLEPLAAPDILAAGIDVDASMRVQIQGAFNMLDQFSSGFEYPADGGEWFIDASADYCLPVNSAGPTNPIDEWEAKISNAAVVTRIIRGKILTGHGPSTPGAGTTIAMSVGAFGSGCTIKQGVRFYKADLTPSAVPDYIATTPQVLAAGVWSRSTVMYNAWPGDAVYAAPYVQVEAGSGVTGAWLRVRELRLPSCSGWVPTTNCKTFCVVKPSLWNIASPVTPIYGDLALLVSAAAAGNLSMGGVFPPAAVPGQEYTSQAAFSPVRGAPQRQVQMAMSFLDAGVGFLVGGGFAASVAEAVPGSWIEAKGTFVSPAGTAYILASPQVIGAALDEQHLIDGIAIYPGHLGRYGAGGWTGSTFGYEAIRSIDGGANWTDVAAVKAATVDARTQAVTIYDREAPLGKSIQYQARATATSSALGSNISGYCTAVGGVVLPTSAWLKCPKFPFFDMPITLLVPFTPKLVMATGLFEDIIGLDEPLVATDGTRGYRGDATIQVDGDAQWDRLQALLYCGEVLLLQDTVGEQFYIRPIGEVSRDTMRAVPVPGSPYPIRKLFRVTVPFTTVAAPS